jgi:hypothetical protein
VSPVSQGFHYGIYATPLRLYDSANVYFADYIVHTTTDAAAYSLKLGSTDKSRSDILLLSDVMHKKHCGFKQFVSNVVRRSQTRTSTILVALLYLKRAKVVMEIPPPQWILHRLFMGALILATKVRHISRSSMINRD